MVDTHNFDVDCKCERCTIIRALILKEARASVAMSHDERAQTIVVE